MIHISLKWNYQHFWGKFSRIIR